MEEKGASNMVIAILTRSKPWKRFIKKIKNLQKMFKNENLKINN